LKLAQLAKSSNCCFRHGLAEIFSASLRLF